jgi:hypothetical protein
MTRKFAAGLALALGMHAPASQAVVHCVTNEADLRAAFAAIGAPFALDHREVRLQARTYYNGAERFDLTVASSTGDLRVSGGWLPGPEGPCSIQVRNARSTVIDAQGASAVMRLRRNGASNSETPLIEVSNLTIRNGSAVDGPAGLEVSNSFGAVLVEDLVLHGHRLTQPFYHAASAMMLASDRGDIRMRNVLAFDSQSPPAAFGTLLPVVLLTSSSLNPGRHWHVTNSTILAAPDLNQPVLRMQSDGNFWVVNSLLRGQVAYAGSSTGSGAATPPQLRQLYNSFSALPDTGAATVLSSVGNDTQDPLLHPSGAPAAESPAIDSGLGNPPGGGSLTDVQGGQRLFGSQIDRGAIESQVPKLHVFRSGFE